MAADNILDMRESLFDTPPVVPFVECPNCKQLLDFGAPNCPRCREEISPEYAAISAAVVYHNTQACSVANSISSFNAFIPLALVGGIGIDVLDWYISDSPQMTIGIVLWPLMPLLAIVVWYFRFGRFAIGDDEYLRARHEMKRSFLFWLVLFVVQLLLILLAVKPLLKT